MSMRAVLGCLIAGLAFSAICTVALGAPRERDVWHAYVADGHRYGYRRTTVTALPDGNYRYTIEFRILYDLVGALQDLTSRAEYVITEEYAPVSLRIEGNLGSGRSLVVGLVEGDRMMLTTERAGVKGNRTVDLSGKPIFDECLDDWLNDQPADLNSATVNTIDSEVVDLQTSEWKRTNADPSESIWHFTLGTRQEGVISYDSDEIRREAKFTVPRLHTKRVAAAEAKQIKHFKLDGRDMLMFPLGDKTPAPEHLASLKVKLVWTGIPFEEFQFEDCRQRVTETERKGDRFGAVLQIQPAKLLDTEMRFPVEEPGLEPFLAETVLIKPHHSEIAAKAREWCRGKETVLEAAKALSHEVCNHLVGGSIVIETLSGPEVLESKHGKCSEATTLFASLARSLGIPTRVVFGLRMVGGYSMVHGWCEVFAGEWITVDPLVNEVHDSMALLKLCHSDSLLGVNRLRWLLTGSLDFSIESFETRPDALSGRFKTGFDGRTYTNADVACRFTVPSDAWSIRDQSKLGLVMIRFRVPDQNNVHIMLTASRLPLGMPVKTLIAIKREKYGLIFRNFTLLKDEPYTTNALGGHRLMYRRSSGGGKKQEKLQITEVTWSRGPFGYTLSMTSDESAHEKHVADFDKLLTSFEYLGDRPAGQ